jgi:hypothetical protein
MDVAPVTLIPKLPAQLKRWKRRHLKFEAIDCELQASNQGAKSISRKDFPTDLTGVFPKIGRTFLYYSVDDPVCQLL